MSQPSVASFFNSRKRAAGDDIHQAKGKVFVTAERISSIQEHGPNFPTDADHFRSKLDSIDFQSAKSEINNLLQPQKDGNEVKLSTTRSGRVIKKREADKTENTTKGEKTEEPIKLKQQKLVQFVKKGNLSPIKKLQKADGSPAAFSKSANILNVERGLSTPPTKQIVHNVQKDTLRTLVKKELSFDEVKTKISRSAKLQELKASLHRIQELEKVRKAQEEKNRRLRNGQSKSSEKPVSLKEFKTIELEVLTSPKKGFRTPTKLPPPPDKNALMSPKQSTTPKRILFSPSKDGSPAKIVTVPAYQRFVNLVEFDKPSLQLPYKYRCLAETFKALDTVCAMFFNRKEIITFKKLKPAVQRMLRRNFNESHLAQIRHLYPEAYNFQQMKMRNFGSTSKQDYFQLIVTPNVENVALNPQLAKIDEDNIVKSAQSNAMNPQVMIERHQKFTNILLNKVKDEHDKFLKSLAPPLVIPRDKVTRWHPEFDLEKCPDIDTAHLPQPPNVEKYSSAKDILSTARNLFNCATPLERALERFDEKNDEEKKLLMHPTLETEKKTDDHLATLLKGVPQSLLEKIRTKQAAKALDAMTRRPSQDIEAIKYSRLPELARHLRNVFITEKKAVLALEVIVRKIENSYRACLSPREIEQHLKLIEKECPKWITFHEIRKTTYLKIAKDMDLNNIVEKLENAANDKSK